MGVLHKIFCRDKILFITNSTDKFVINNKRKCFNIESLSSLERTTIFFMSEMTVEQRNLYRANANQNKQRERSKVFFVDKEQEQGCVQFL